MLLPIEWPAYNIVSLSDSGQQFGRVLQVVVKGKCQFTRSVANTCNQGVVLSVVASSRKRDIAQCEFTYNHPRIIATTIFQKSYFEDETLRPQNSDKARIQLVKAFDESITWNDD